MDTENKFFYEFPTTGLMVLVVDNNLNILEIIKQMCLECHYNVVTFSDAPFALNYVRENKYFIDVILAEVHMPNMDGFEFLKNVTEEVNVPFIMMSYDGSTSSVMKCVTQGACDYWIKPVPERQVRLMWKHVAKKIWNENKQSRKDDLENASLVVDEQVKNQEEGSSNSKESADHYAAPTKKTRAVWSKELHQQFVAAVMQIGFKDATPKRILEVMQNPSLTRDQVDAPRPRISRLVKGARKEIAPTMTRLGTITRLQTTPTIEDLRIAIVDAPPTTTRYPGMTARRVTPTR
ncbi:hypothetical protein VNO78_33573 [Psophocarpus tetragonolobus]|uniref:Response regulatory domain-containing protein n=1 Tax=Psophocarpus tetragonolobus TaxID=3891 RepID=A0AAN9RQ81_PSOTE